MDLANIFEKFFNWIKTAPQFLFAISLACAGLLYLNSDTMNALGLESFRTANRAYIGLTLIISIALLASYPVKSLFDWGKVLFRNYRQQQIGKDLLKTLSPEQKKILKKFMDKNSRSATLDFADGNVTELTKNGVIYLPAKFLLMGTYTDYNLQPWAFKFLKKHPDIIEG